MQFGPEFRSEIVATYATLLGNVVEFGLVAVGLYLVGRLLVTTVGRWSLEQADFDPTMVDGIASFLHLAAILLAVVVGASAADFRGAFAGSALVAGGVTLAVGLGAQDVLGNFVAGAFLVSDPDVNVGDRIRWEDEEGIISGIDLRVTRITTLDNDTVVVPNQVLSTSVVRNLTANDPVGISHGFAVRDDQVAEAVEAITAAVRSHDDFLDAPAPTVRVTDVTGSGVVVTARAFFPLEMRSQRYRIRTEFLWRVAKQCREAGVDLSPAADQRVADRPVVEPADRTDADGEGGGRAGRGED